MIVLTDGRPWYKQVVSGCLKGLALALVIGVIYPEPKIFIVLSVVFLLTWLYDWSMNGD